MLFLESKYLLRLYYPHLNSYAFFSRIDEIMSWTVQYPHSPLNKTFSKTIDSTTYEYNIATTALHKPATYSKYTVWNYKH